MSHCYRRFPKPNALATADSLTSCELRWNDSAKAREECGFNAWVTVKSPVKAFIIVIVVIALQHAYYPSQSVDKRYCSRFVGQTPLLHPFQMLLSASDWGRSSYLHE